MLSASVVINTFNRAESLRLTLEGLTLLDYPLFEVVVVNGPSTDGTESVLSQYESRIKVSRLTERNLSMSRNLGIAAAAGDIVAFIDDDAYPDPAWLNHLVKAFDEAEVAAAGGPTYDYTGYELQARYNMANRTGEAWWPNSGDAIINPTEILNRPFPVIFPYVTGTNSSFRRSSLLEIGGFDEEFDYYLDETDVCLRLIDSGYVVRALDDGYVYHKFLSSHLRTHARALKNRFSVIKNRVYFAVKHGRLTNSFYDISKDLIAFVERHRRECRAHVELGLLTEEDYLNFERDVHAAFDTALTVIQKNRSKAHPSSWFAGRPTPFLSFQTRRPSETKLHLCFLSKEYPPGAVNGISRFTHEMASGLAEMGHHVHVLTEGEDHHRVDLEDGVWVHRIVPSYHRRPRFPVVPQDVWDYSASLYDEVLRIHHYRPLDCVEAPIWDSEGIAAILGKDVPVAVSLHTPLAVALAINPHWGADAANLKIRLKPLLALERFCLQQCDAILANSKAIIDELNIRHEMKLDERKTLIIPHGSGQEIATKKETHPRSRDTRVLFIGRLERRKGIDILLESIEELTARCPGISFTIVGDDKIPSEKGPTYRELFEKHVDPSRRPHVLFTGRVGDDEIERQYADCDIFVAPSRYESFGLIYIEAMRHGKPVIGCNVGGVPEVITDGENGILIPPDNSGALSDAIEILADNPVLRHRMGRRALGIYTSRFTRRAMAGAAEKFYFDLSARTKQQMPNLQSTRR